MKRKRTAWFAALCVLTILAGLAGCSGPPEAQIPSQAARSAIPGKTAVPETRTDGPRGGTRAEAESDTAVIIIGEKSGKRPQMLFGVNGGPVKALPESKNAIDLTEAYRSAGIDAIRIHDMFQGKNENPLDTAYIYPDETKDPGKASSYRFEEGDKVFREILQKGFDVYFRLGNSYSFSPSPKNTENWVKAAVRIVSHYYDISKEAGRPIRYVEIWNEPDNGRFWDKPVQQYFELYDACAKAIKKEYPELKVGGPAFTPAFALMEKGRQYTQNFLKFLKKNGTPLDFFSWHMYSNDPQDFDGAGAYVQELLRKFEYKNTESHLTEYNIELKQPEEIFVRPESAALTAAFWISAQKNGVTQAFYYRGNDPDTDRVGAGLFWADGRPKPASLAFTLLRKFCDCAELVEAQTDKAGGLYVLCGEKDTGETCLLLSNPYNVSKNVEIQFPAGIQNPILQIEKLSPDADAVETETANANQVKIGGYGVMLITIRG